MKPAPDLATFGRVLEVLHSEALRCLTETEDNVARKAWRRVTDSLADAVENASQRDMCPVCGELTDVTECRWCGGAFCGNACEAAVHETPGRCEHAPQPEAPAFTGEPDDDITF